LGKPRFVTQGKPRSHTPEGQTESPRVAEELTRHKHYRTGAAARAVGSPTPDDGTILPVGV
jgi:hypothetical protein